MPSVDQIQAKSVSILFQLPSLQIFPSLFVTRRAQLGRRPWPIPRVPRGLPASRRQGDLSDLHPVTTPGRFLTATFAGFRL
jgi:hypothetical protein